MLSIPYSPGAFGRLCQEHCGCRVYLVLLSADACVLLFQGMLRCPQQNPFILLLCVLCVVCVVLNYLDLVGWRFVLYIKRGESFDNMSKTDLLT